MQNICIKAVNYPYNLLLMMHIFVLAFTTFKDLSKVEFSFEVCFTLNPPQKISETFFRYLSQFQFIWFMNSSIF